MEHSFQVGDTSFNPDGGRGSFELPLDLVQEWSEPEAEEAELCVGITEELCGDGTKLISATESVRKGIKLHEDMLRDVCIIDDDNSGLGLIGTSGYVKAKNSSPKDAPHCEMAALDEFAPFPKEFTGVYKSLNNELFAPEDPQEPEKQQDSEEHRDKALVALAAWQREKIRELNELEENAKESRLQQRFNTLVQRYQDMHASNKDTGEDLVGKMSQNLEAQKYQAVLVLIQSKADPKIAKRRAFLQSLGADV